MLYLDISGNRVAHILSPWHNRARSKERSEFIIVQSTVLVLVMLLK